MITKFWLVWSEVGGSPRYKHETFDAAKEEARRLAASNAGTKFYVLGAEGFALKQDPVTWVETDEIPF
jgi:hypothetical protein